MRRIAPIDRHDDFPRDRRITLGGKLEYATHAATTGAARRATTRRDRRTPGQERRYLRNIAICLAVKAGMTHRRAALAFDLPASRISAIVKEFAGKAKQTLQEDDES